jgi:cyclophilin family peptidyl-prolyl cis-trans isomerase
VVEGFDVIDKIAAVKTGGANRPEENVKMKIELVK